MSEFGTCVGDLLHQRAREEAGRLGDAEFQRSTRPAGAVREQRLVAFRPVFAIEFLPQLWQQCAPPSGLNQEPALTHDLFIAAGAFQPDIESKTDYVDVRRG